MIKVDFYKFSKKDNSTKRPAIADRKVEYSSCLIKDGSGIVNPTLQIATKENVSEWNYCYIPDFNRYYFISEWTYDLGQWIASCRCDELATWKSQIGSSTQYIVRSASAHDGNIDDNYYPGKTVSTISHHIMNGGSLATTMLVPESPTIQNFMVGIINNDSTSAAGAVSYYTMGTTRLGRMKHSLMTDNGWIGNVEPGATSVEISQSKVDINPFQYIASCRWFPVNVPHDDTVTNNIRCGWWESDFSGFRFSGGQGGASAIWTLTTPRHPQATRGAYLNNKGFSSYIMDFAGFHFELDANMVAQSSSLEVDLFVDFISGQGCVKVFGVVGSDQFLIAEQIQNISVSIPIAQITYSSEGLSGMPVIGSLVGLGQSVGSWIAGGVSGSHHSSWDTGMNAVGAALGYNKIQSSFTAGAGGLAAITAHPKPLLTCVFQHIVDEDLASAGRPLCANRTISSLSGFVKCNHVELELPAMDSEVSDIVRMMEGGFFYE